MPRAQEKGTSEEKPASRLPLGMACATVTNVAATLILKIFSTPLFKDSIMKKDFEIHAHAKSSDDLYARMYRNA